MTQISGVTPNLFSTSKGTGAKTTKQSMSVAEQFAGIMNQNAGDLFGNRSDLSADSGKATTVTSKAPSTNRQNGNSDRDTAAMGAGKNRPIKETQADTKVTDVASNEQELQSLGEEIKEQIEDSLDLTEEEVTEVMELLGLTTMDLLDTQNIVALVQELTGSDSAMELLTNDSFQQLMADVTELIGNFEQVNELSPKEFAQVVETVLQSQGQTLPEDAPLTENAGTMTTLEASDTVDTVDGITVPQGQETVEQPNGSEAVAEEQQPQTTAKEEVTAPQTPVAEESVNEQPLETEELPAWETAKDNSDETGQNMEQSTSDPSKDLFKQKEQKAESLINEHANYQPDVTNAGQTRGVNAQPVVTAADSYLDAEQLLAQFEGMARTLATDSGTTIEMQLNPANLGRLFLSVSEKEGNVSATITASNEEVKEALQTQMAALRETLQMQGIKVEAVEVTVATHEFEQNLDGNQSANGQAQSEREQQAQAEAEKSGRRNLNLNDLDGLSGLMSEEERLVAQMMADQGNSVDFKA